MRLNLMSSYIVLVVLSALSVCATAGTLHPVATLSVIPVGPFGLSGVYPAWQDARPRRQALYSDFPPREHVFEVMAANEDGVRSTQSPKFQFRVASRFYQTGWFRAIVAALVVSLLALGIWLRTEQIKARLRQDMAARTYERERIARDLHDTLLQGVQSRLLRINIWANDRRLPAELRTEIREVSENARDIVVEGRDRILSLRNGGRNDSDLPATLHGMRNAWPTSESPTIEVVTIGAPRALTVDAYQQLVDIAREAVRNAIQHAQCQRIMVTVEYGCRSIELTVTDDGCGIAPAATLPDCPSGHYGVQGMRERAWQLGATIRFARLGATGTKVSVLVPAAVAFPDAMRSAWSRFSRYWLYPEGRCSGYAKPAEQDNKVRDAAPLD